MKKPSVRDFLGSLQKLYLTQLSDIVDELKKEVLEDRSGMHRVQSLLLSSEYLRGKLATVKDVMDYVKR